MMNTSIDTLAEYINSIQHVETIDQFQQATERLRDLLNIQHVVYHWVNSAGERFGVGTYSQEWVDRYLEKDYLRLDPVIFGCFQRFTAVNWKQLDWSTKAARAFYEEAIEYGVGNQGYTIPMRGPNGQFALFTLNTTGDDQAWERFIAMHDRELILISHEFNKRALEFEAGRVDLQTPSLSPRELSAISALARGLSRAQASAELGISEHTFRVYVESARHKLGALNTTHAVARAISIGIVLV